MDAEQRGWIETHMGLAQSLAKQKWRTAPHALDLEDMRAIAYYGLVMVAARWRDYCKENNFDPNALEFMKPFVVRRVNGALLDAIRSDDWATRSLRSRARQLQEAGLGQQRGLTYDELSNRTGLTVAEVRATQRGIAQRPTSLEAEEIDPTTDSDVESNAFAGALLTVVVDTIRSLDADQQAVVALHYHRGLQLRQVAHAMGITESRASQLHAKAVLAIHEAMKTAAEQNEKP